MPGYDYEHNTQKLPSTNKSTNFHFNFKLNLPPPNLTIPKSNVGANAANRDPLYNKNSDQIKDCMKLMTRITGKLDANGVPNIGHIEPFVGNSGQLTQDIDDIGKIDPEEWKPTESGSEESKESDFVPEKMPPSSESSESEDSGNCGLQAEHFCRYLRIAQNKPFDCLIKGFKIHLSEGKSKLRQPTREDVIDYLAHAIFIFDQTHKYDNETDDKIREWLIQMKSFFDWTKKQGIYRNIAFFIYPKDIHDKFIECQTKQENEKKMKEESAKQKLKEKAAEKAKKLAQKQALSMEDEKKAQQRAKNRQLAEAREQRAEENALKELTEPEKEVDPQAIDVMWLDQFIKSLDGQISNETIVNINVTINALKNYIEEYDVNKLTKRDILKVLTRYSDLKTFNSIEYNRYSIRRCFRWMLESGKPVSPDILFLVPTYTTIKRFERKTTIEGNSQLQTASFNDKWFDQCLKDIEKIELKSSYTLSSSHINALRKYLNKHVPELQINPSHILDFFIMEKPTISEENVHKYLASYQTLFKWSAIKETEMESMYYPDIMGYRLKRGILGQLIPILRDEYDRQTAIGQSPKHPTSKYFSDFMGTIKQPDDSETPITFENFINYLKVIKNIHIPDEDIDPQPQIL